MKLRLSDNKAGILAMFPFTKVLSFFKPRPTMAAPSLHFLDPDVIIKPAHFLYLFTSWAPKAPPNFLDDYRVVTFMLNNMPKPPEHEFIILETLDKECTSRLFILERTIHNEQRPTITADRPDTKLYQKAKKLATTALSTLTQGADPLSLMEEGPAHSSSSSVASLSIIDTLSLSATQSADMVSDSLHKSYNVPAIDQFLGENFVHRPQFAGQNVRYFKPNGLTLFEFVLLAQVVHEAYPTYSLLGEQCYFYAGLVYDATEKYFGVCPSEKADKSGDVVYHIDSHLSNKYGRWNGIKVNRTDPEMVLDVIEKYKKAHTQHIAEVILVFVQISITDCILHRWRRTLPVSQIWRRSAECKPSCRARYILSQWCSNYLLMPAAAWALFLDSSSLTTIFCELSPCWQIALF
jgi:hypothetical protein